MGVKADTELSISFDELRNYLHSKHAVYMDHPEGSYYLTDVNDRYWRVQDTTKLNEKNHYTDCSELVPTIGEFLNLPFHHHGKTISEMFDEATFYESLPAVAE